MRMGSGEDFTVSKFIVSTVHLIGIVKVIKYSRFRWAGR